MSLNICYSLTRLLADRDYVPAMKLAGITLTSRRIILSKGNFSKNTNIRYSRKRKHMVGLTARKLYTIELFKQI